METVAKRSASEKTAKFIRIITVPPLMAMSLVLLLMAVRPETFLLQSGPMMMITFLSLMPASAYPLSVLIPGIRKAGRDGQRNLAFILSGIGYVSGFVYGLAGSCTRDELTIYGIYLFSVILLLVFNKLLHIRASGHACSVTGPLVLCCLFLGAAGVTAGLITGAAIVWSSLKLKRHTLKELALGAMLCIMAGILSFWLFRIQRA